MRAAILLAVALLAACSTLDRRSYYQPVAEPAQLSGPERLPCGFANLGGGPTTYEHDDGVSRFSISAGQDVHPYLFGPWFISVIPVFPITWIAELFIDDRLVVHLVRHEGGVDPLGARFVARIGDKDLPAQTRMLGRDRMELTFPVRDSETKDFVLMGELDGKPLLSLPFKRTARWAWTQWTPNC
ncbi:hypothetical protein [Solimonas sp. SE-A11]|uniref:hypothetical protein n=1 Tax=Solimonas sp. SE-A11 TaxID=3054954 RepID=UPI00259CBF08|nr:hypothetical protein [Solimonas sp. SE-A11]MDM4770550.1 hypothetical protein [Solimonas sp. SE-A11]